MDHPVFNYLDQPDLEFLFEIIRGPVGFTADKRIKMAVKHAADEERISAARALVLKEIRYLGSSDVAYLLRKVFRRSEPGVPLREVVLDVFKKLKLKVPEKLCTDEELLASLAVQYTSDQLQKMNPEKQRRYVADCGVSKEVATEFVLACGKRLAPPVILQFVGAAAGKRLITNVVINSISGYVGKEAAQRLVGGVITRFPKWGQALGPLAWGVTGFWTVYDVQRPAMRKTVPICLYLGLCVVKAAGQKYD